MYTGIGMGNSSDGSLPNIWGSLDFGDRTPINGWTPTNAFAYNGNIAAKAYYSNSATQSNKNSGVNFYASRCGVCYGRYNEDRVYPSHLCMRLIIKYDI